MAEVLTAQTPNPRVEWVTPTVKGACGGKSVVGVTSSTRFVVRAIRLTLLFQGLTSTMAISVFQMLDPPIKGPEMEVN